MVLVSTHGLTPARGCCHTSDDALAYMCYAKVQPVAMLLMKLIKVGTLGMPIQFLHAPFDMSTGLGQARTNARLDTFTESSKATAPIIRHGGTGLGLGCFGDSFLASPFVFNIAFRGRGWAGLAGSGYWEERIFRAPIWSR